MPDNENGTAFSPRAFRRSLRRDGITPTQYRVAVELCEYASQDKSVVWPSVAALADDCGVDRRTVIRSLNQLESKGFIVCDGRRKGGRGCSTRWRLVIKGDTSATLYDTKRVTSQTKRVTSVTEKGDTRVTRSSKEEGEKGGTADAAPGPPLKQQRPRDCCAQHEPPGVEGCDACERAWHKAENWDFYRPESWADYCADSLETFPESWMAQGPPLLCERGHEVGAACGTCRDLRLAREKWDKHRATWEHTYNEDRREITRCRTCNSVGHIWIGGDPEPWFCDHGTGLGGELGSLGTVSSVPPTVTPPVADVRPGPQEAVSGHTSTPGRG